MIQAAKRPKAVEVASMVSQEILQNHGKIADVADILDREYGNEMRLRERVE
ncbi:MAG: hypothetical protein ACF8OB_17875 [Phycisphaeraceae bacterium JB051]